MKRYAAHYLFISDCGFVKQYVVEIADGGVALNAFPLTEEIESVEWLPGVIALLTTEEARHWEECKKTSQCFFSNVPMFFSEHPNVFSEISQCLSEAFAARQEAGEMFYAYLLYPFDFTLMQPVAGTQSRQLR